MTDTNEDPWELTSYINTEHKSIVDNNSCEHRPTHPPELERMEKRVRGAYDRGLKMMEEIGKEDLSRCGKMYSLDDQYWGLNLIECKVLGKWVLVPRYVRVIEKMRKLREAIT